VSDDAPRTCPFTSRSRLHAGLKVGWSSFATPSTAIRKLQRDGEVVMSLTIQGGFEAYVWAALWQVALGGMQAGASSLDPRRSRDGLGARMQNAVSFIGSAISWGAWGLGVWVALHSGMLAGVAFTSLGFGINVVTIIELRRVRQNLVATQIAAFLVMPLFAFETLLAIGVPVR
jgi:hypothetical protein